MDSIEVIDLLDTIKLTPLKKIDVSGGNVLHGIKNIEESYNGFGEAYFTFVKYNNIKAWKKHKKMIMNLIVPIGSVKFVFYDEMNKKFRAEKIGINNYARLTVPSGIYFGFKGLDKDSNLVLNFSNILHNPNEVKKKLLDEIPYEW